MYQHPEGRTVAQGFFSTIPSKDLVILLSKLPETERFCKRGDELGIQKIIDQPNIDPVYKAQFFSGINALRSL